MKTFVCNYNTALPGKEKRKQIIKIKKEIHEKRITINSRQSNNTSICSIKNTSQNKMFVEVIVAEGRAKAH